MLNFLLRSIILFLLRLRYRISVRGLREIRQRGTRGILFLPTHPALIDPVMLTALLLTTFRARPFADQDAVNMPGIRWLVARARAFTIPTIARYGQSAAERINAIVKQSIEALRGGDNVILYPAGHLMRSRYEEIGGNSAVETIVHALPGVRIVLVKTRGLWGSEFGLASGKDPDVGRNLLRGIRQILANFILFTPRRDVTLEFVEPEDFPRAADRATINAYLERFYNEDAPPAQYVPYTIWERQGRHEMPDPEWGGVPGHVEDVPEGTRKIVYDRLREMSGVQRIEVTHRLDSDLGMDSLARVELMAWLETEFGLPQGNSESLQTVSDVLLAAFGEATGAAVFTLKPVPAPWFAAEEDRILAVEPGDTIPACFLAAAERQPDQMIVADQTSGAKTYRQLILGILALLPLVKALPGERLGIMLPASVAACVAYLTALFAGRTPVMVNWTVGRRNILHGLELTGTERILTAKALVSRLEQGGMDLAGIKERFVYLEDLAAGISTGAKLRALLASRTNWGALRKAVISPTAAILFTSGSESLPKAVPLTHANILTDLRETLPIVKLNRRDRILAMLPPFHSFGLTGNLVVSLTAGLRAAFYPNPTEGPVLARIIEAYKTTVVIGTPTFLNGILRAATAQKLASVRLAFAGAEETPERVYAMFTERCPQAVLIEGYGITECSPIVAANSPDDPHPHTIGRLLASLDYALVNVETGRPVPPGTPGMLLLKGPSIFAGYLGDAPDPFVEYNGEQWYRTGDLVMLTEDGLLKFAGRLKRFVKLGGEMISLPAIESALLEKYGSAEDEGPILAVTATADERPELVLFTVRDIDREAANNVIRSAGLSALYNIRRVEKVDAIPVLGTGKTDYRKLQERLAKE
ncbi:MAG: AMP-binding protein [Armatimonadota bacterium]